MSADDRLAILDQIARYSYAWDGKDSDAYAALFTEDAVFEVFTRGDKPVIHNEGREAIRRWARATHSGERPGLRPPPPDEQTRHNQSGTVFDELGEDAARTVVVAPDPRDHRGHERDPERHQRDRGQSLRPPVTGAVLRRARAANHR